MKADRKTITAWRVHTNCKIACQAYCIILGCVLNSCDQILLNLIYFIFFIKLCKKEKVKIIKKKGKQVMLLSENSNSKEKK